MQYTGYKSLVTGKYYDINGNETNRQALSKNGGLVLWENLYADYQSFDNSNNDNGYVFKLVRTGDFSGSISRGLMKMMSAEMETPGDEGSTFHNYGNTNTPLNNANPSQQQINEPENNNEEEMDNYSIPETNDDDTQTNNSYATNIEEPQQNNTENQQQLQQDNNIEAGVSSIINKLCPTLDENTRQQIKADIMANINTIKQNGDKESIKNCIIQILNKYFN